MSLLYWQRLQERQKARRSTHGLYHDSRVGIELPCQQSCSIDPQSLYAAFEQVPDGRDKQGKQYRLALLLTLLMLAKLAGETSVSGAAHWLRLRRDWLCWTLQLSRDRLPCQGTYYYALRNVQAEHVQAAVQQFLASLPKSQTQREPTLRQLAMDGKTDAAAHWAMTILVKSRSTRLSVYDVHAGRVLAQQQVHKKQNEISEAPQLLKQIQVEDCLLSSDALHTQRKWCRHVDKRQGKYVVIAKDNQRALRQEIALLFEDPQADRRQWHSITLCEKGHGRARETRAHHQFGVERLLGGRLARPTNCATRWREP